MPRVIEPKIGKVVGPLHMKVVPTSSVTNCKTSTQKNQECDKPFTTSSNLEIRRGRYSRNLNGLKKNRSKSLTSPKETSLLFGPPLEVDTSLEENPTDLSPAHKTSSVYKSQELRVDTPKVTIQNDEDPTKISVIEPSQRHALAIDTRYLVTSNSSNKESPSIVEHMIGHVKDLTKALHSRGISPCIVASTTAANTTSRPQMHSNHDNKRVTAALANVGIGIQAQKILHDDSTKTNKVMEYAKCTLCSQVDVPSTISNIGAFSVPQPLNAAFSWMIFSAMVDAIMTEDSKFVGFVPSNHLKKCRAPINVTIICSDVSLFCDTMEESHRTGLQSFFEHVTPYFQKGLLSSIDIVTAVTNGKLALFVEQSDDCNPSQRAPGSTPEAVDSERQNSHLKAMMKCVRMIEWTINEAMNGFLLSHDEPTGSSISCSFVTIKNSRCDFHALSHSLIRKELVGRNIQLACRLRHVDLPVSSDGTHCSLSLEASYDIFPFLVHSLQAKMLSSELIDLSTMHLEVVKLIPLSIVDVSLLFGVPLVVRASLERDYAQFQEMKVLVRSLFRVLQKQEQAILLRGSSPNKARKRTSVSDHDMDHFSSSYLSEQHFLLMAQEIPSTLLNNENSPAAPNSGLLLRIAHTDHLLHDKYMMDSMHGKYDSTDDDHETEMQYMEYVENSLATLSLSSYNPFTNFPSNHGQSLEPKVIGIEGVEEDMNTTNSDLEEETLVPVDVSMSLPTSEKTNTSNAMEISNIVTKLSIYDLHTTSDDMTEY